MCADLGGHSTTTTSKNSHKSKKVSTTPSAATRQTDGGKLLNTLLSFGVDLSRSKLRPLACDTNQYRPALEVDGLAWQIANSKTELNYECTKFDFGECRFLPSRNSARTGCEVYKQGGFALMRGSGLVGCCQ